MLDSNGANTTAAAAVRAAGRHLDLGQPQSLVLGGTGPVGQRVARLLARHGGHVRIGSRQQDRAEAVCAAIRGSVPGAERRGGRRRRRRPTARRRWTAATLVVAAGAAGGGAAAEEGPRRRARRCRWPIDLNGVPPAGIEGVEVDRQGRRTATASSATGRIGVGGTKMKIHKAAVAKLFEPNNAVLDVEEIYDIALKLP